MTAALVAAAAVPSFAPAVGVTRTREAIMTGSPISAIKPDTSIVASIRGKLLDAKRVLEKAKDEVDHGENDPLRVSLLIEMALNDVMAALKASQD